MAELMEGIRSWLSFLQRISAKNLIEIVIISILIYEVLYWIKNSLDFGENGCHCSHGASGYFPAGA